MKYWAALALAVPAGGVAPASTPTGARHGRWHVLSITSLSGARGDDASALIVQENDAGQIEVHWTDGGSISVSMRIEHCHGAQGGHDDFGQHYSLGVGRWLRTPVPALVRRLNRDFSVWLEQARFACSGPGALNAFDLRALNAAVADFTAQLNYLATHR